MPVFKKLGADTLIFGLLSCLAQEGKVVFVVSLDGPLVSVEGFPLVLLCHISNANKGAHKT